MKKISPDLVMKGSVYASMGLTLMSCGSNNKSSEHEQTMKPNIIYILADDLGYGDLSCYGQKKFSTPELDKLAGEGMMFTQHYAGSTVCAPSRCSLLTGKHTGHAFIRGNKEVKPEGQAPMASDEVTVAELLKKAGYYTGVIGKWGLGAPGTEGIPTRQGFDYAFGYNCQREAHHYYPEHLWKNDEKIMIEENLDNKRGVFTHDLFTKECLDFIKSNRDTSFFLYLAYTIPHADIDVPEDSKEPFKDKYEEVPYEGDHYISQPEPFATFAGMVTRMDGDVGKIKRLLTELGLDKNTLVIFTSDNGPHLEGGHSPDYFDSNGPLKGYKRDLYEGGIRVPMIAWWPSVIQSGAKTDHISAFWDFMPTACEIAGITPPENIDGISYLPVLKGKEQKSHDYLYWEFHEQGAKQAVRMDDWKGIKLNLKENPHAKMELYNLSEDPGEENNIAGEYPEIVNQIEKIMIEAREPSEMFAFPTDTVSMK